MHPRTRLPDELLALAHAQGGVVTAAQAFRAGVSEQVIRGMARDGRWHRLANGIYSLEPDGWLPRVWAGVLVGGTTATLGGLAAAHLHGMADEPDIIDVWTSDGTQPRRKGPWRFRRGVRKRLGAPPRASVEETTLDLCAGATPDEQSAWLAKALTNRRTTPQRLGRALDQAPRLKGRAGIRELLEVVAGGTESPLEVRYLRDVERAHGLPEGQRQKSMSHGTRSDVLYEAYAVIVELDGRLGHRGPGERRDAWRDAQHLAQGLVTLRFGWADVAHQPCEVASAVAEVLRSRGWLGSELPASCCPRAA